MIYNLSPAANALSYNGKLHDINYIPVARIEMDEIKLEILEWQNKPIKTRQKIIWLK